jgi:hypothetical protein
MSLTCGIVADLAGVANCPSMDHVQLRRNSLGGGLRHEQRD